MAVVVLPAVRAAGEEVVRHGQVGSRWFWDRGGGDGTGRRGDSRDDGLLHNSYLRILKRHLQDSLAYGNMLISLLSFGNFWPGQEDQREATEMAEGRGKVTTFSFIVSQPHSTLHKALSNITLRVLSSLSRHRLVKGHHQPLKPSHLSPTYAVLCLQAVPSAWNILLPI